jgi:hypothetical protein
MIRSLMAEGLDHHFGAMRASGNKPRRHPGDRLRLPAKPSSRRSERGKKNRRRPAAADLAGDTTRRRHNPRPRSTLSMPALQTHSRKSIE